MNQQARIEAEITFLPESEGGRAMPLGILSGIVEGELYLGVAFLSGPGNVEPGKTISAELALIYYPNPIYDALVPDGTFTIREGARIVGYSRVGRIIAPNAA